MEINLNKLAQEVETEIKPIFEEVDIICEKNSKKVLEACQE